MNRPLPAASPLWDEVVLVVGTRRWDGRRSTAERLAEGLADHAAVLVVIPERRGKGRDSEHPLRVVGPHLAQVVVPAGSVGAWPGLASFDAARAGRTIRRALVELGSPTVRAVVVTSPTAALDAVDADVRVFAASDDLLDGWTARSRRPRVVEHELNRTQRWADVVIAGSPTLAAAIGGAGSDPVVVPDGVDDAAFAPRRPPATGAPVAGFVGDLAADVDLNALEAVADRGHELLLVGRGPRRPYPAALAQLLRRPNVEWVGPRPRDEIPELVARCRVGLVPLVDSPYTRARLPLDALVHLAAGQPVVGTRCEPVRWLRARGRGRRSWLGDGSGSLRSADVVGADEPGGFADLVERRLAVPPGAAAVDRRRRFAWDHRWSVRAAEVAALIGVGRPDVVESAR